MRTALRHRTGTKAKGRAPDVMLERPDLREDTGQVRGEGKDPFPILGSLYAKRRLVRISRKDSKVPFSARSECTQRPGPPKDTPPLLTPDPFGVGNAGILGSPCDYESQQLAPNPYNKRSIRGGAEG